jgi:hypothetical protein
VAYSDTIRRFEQRKAHIAELKRRGWTVVRIAAKYKVSRARVYQLLQQ